MLELRQYGIDTGLLISGLMGSMFLASTMRCKVPEKILAMFITGAMSANYLTCFVAALIELQCSEHRYGIAFLVGFLAVGGLELLQEKIPYIKRLIKRKKRS